MKKQVCTIEYEVFSSSEELKPADRDLLQQARTATAAAYAPYSQFKVGAVARFADGDTAQGTNQENASFPVGICAERVLLSVAASVHPNKPIDTIAVSYQHAQGDSNHPISPCGLCRQSLQEYEQRLNHPIRLILGGQSGPVYSIASAGLLLPLAFTPSELKA